MNYIIGIISNTIAFAVPLLLVALGGMFSERSGIINIALEGIMIIGALVGSLLLKFFNMSPWWVSHPQLSFFIVIIASALAGGLFSIILAFASVNLKADQTIGGTALNTFAPAFAVLLTWSIQGQGITTINIPDWISITPATLGLPPSAGTGFFGQIIFKSMYLTTPLSLIILVIATVTLYKTRFGLRLRSCGEHPQASASVGIDVYRMRYYGVIISGILGGIGGLAYTVAVGTGFQSYVSGYGFLALAVMIFGNWKPVRIFIVALLFAFFRAFAGTASNFITIKGVKDLNSLYLMIPYIITMIVLALTSKKSRAPKAEGIPYDKGAR